MIINLNSERLQSAQHLLGVYIGCAICCRYSVPEPLRQDLSNRPGSSLQDVVEKAFARAILEHPLFQVGLVDEDSKKPAWVQLDRIDLHNHVDWRTVEGEDYENELREALEWQINNRFTHLDSQPHCRSVILRPASSKFIDIIFAWDHTHGDGKSGKILHQSLFKFLNADTESGDLLKDRSFKVPPTTLMLPLDKLLKIPTSAGFLLKEGLQVIKSSRNSGSAYTVTWAPVETTPSMPVSRLCYVTVEEDALQAVLEACRQHQTTLTGLIHALTLVSMATRLSKEKARAFQIATPLCLRRFIQPSQSDIDM